ncbi:hypothetical protein BDV12DRAFT_200953 [Aspergillus spectabilis]
MTDADAEEHIAVPQNAVEWDDDTVKGLEIHFAEISDNTTEFTRYEVRTPEPRRYFDIKMTFSWQGMLGSYFKADDAVIPYVPPKDTRRSSRRGAPPTNNYGKGFVYAGLPRPLLDHILNEAASRGYHVASGEDRIPSTAEDWWITLNLAKNVSTKMSRKKGAPFTDASLPRIFMTSKKGITANLIMSIKLKCSVPEALKDDGTYYDWDELSSPAQPAEDQLWHISCSTAEIRITDIDVDVPPPQIVYSATKRAPPKFAVTETDAASDALEGKLKALGL